jgi:hypothetical protein
MSEDMRSQAHVVIYEALELETGGLGPNGSENCGAYLNRCAASVARHLDLAGFLHLDLEVPKPKAAKPVKAKPKAKKRA